MSWVEVTSEPYRQGGYPTLYMAHAVLFTVSFLNRFGTALSFVVILVELQSARAPTSRIGPWWLPHKGTLRSDREWVSAMELSSIPAPFYQMFSLDKVNVYWTASVTQVLLCCVNDRGDRSKWMCGGVWGSCGCRRGTSARYIRQSKVIVCRQPSCVYPKRDRNRCIHDSTGSRNNVIF